MEKYSMLDAKKLNEEFCKLTGIKQVYCFAYNRVTGEVKYYTYRTGKYKIPRSWNPEDTITGSFKDPLYPDFMDPINFTKLIEIQWKIFGSLGPQYTKAEDEPFTLNYLNTKVQAIKLCKSFGGGEMLDIYINQVKDTTFNYPVPDEVFEDDRSEFDDVYGDDSNISGIFN